jgi:WXG100 family type VII secretion target
MPDQKMNYDAMEEMAAVFRASAQQLDETIMVMTGIAANLEGGALLGESGQAFSDAIQQSLNKAVGRMRDKMTELENDIKGAVAYMRDGVDTARSRFL